MMNTIRVTLERDRHDSSKFHVYRVSRETRWHICSVHYDFLPDLLAIFENDLSPEDDSWTVQISTAITSSQNSGVVGR